MRSVVVTGLGTVTSIGLNTQDFWDNLLAGTSGIGPVQSLDTSAYKVAVGGEIPNFTWPNLNLGPQPKEWGRASLFALAAAGGAVKDAGLTAEQMAAKTGVAMGTTSGEPLEIEALNDALAAGQEDVPRGDFMDRYPSHNMAFRIANYFAFHAVPPLMLPAACAAGNYAIAHGYDQIRLGRATTMLVGGSDAFSRITYTGFARMFAIAPEHCQPFDGNRKGMIPGEGAAFLLLEDKQQAHARGARIYAEVAGYGLTCDAHHMTGSHPESRGATNAMELALARSGLSPEDVDYISAHGTGTKSNDAHEAKAVKQVFGAHAQRLAMSSIKSMLGHTMGAASAIEAAVCALAIHHGAIPPTVNYRDPDPDCDLDVVPNLARTTPVRVAMNNAYAFGGTNASVIFKRVEQ